MKFEEFEKTVDTEMANYKAELLAATKEEIIAKSYETAIKNEIYAEIMREDEYNIDELEGIENPIDFLYREYLTSSNADIQYEIVSFLRTYDE